MNTSTTQAHLKAVPENYTAAPGVDKLPALINIENFSLSYDKQPVLESLSLPVYKNHINTLIGPSGCGKSSLLNSIIRLTDYHDNAKLEGSINIEGKNILETSTDLLSLRQNIGMVFQKPMPFPMSIRKNFELPLKEQGVKKRDELDSKIETALKDVGLWDEVSSRLDKSAVQLSGGQQQRLCIARALALQPKALLMDEPCSALDPIATKTIEELILKLKGKYTILIVTHNLSQAKRIADYVAFMWYHQGRGKMIEHNHADVIFNNPSNPTTLAYVQGLTE